MDKASDTCKTGHHTGICCSAPTNPSLCQHLDEIDFERGIWQAALDDDTKRISHLIKNRNVHPDSTDNYGYTALHYAARNGKLKAAQSLIELGASINCQTKNNGSTALHRAALAGKVEMVTFLLQSGADVRLLDADQLSPLERARKEGRDEVVKVLEAHTQK